MHPELTSNGTRVTRSKTQTVVSKASSPRAERDHEVCAALFAIEIAAVGLSRHRDRMSSVQVDELIDGLIAETRRVRALMRCNELASTTFDLGETLAPVLACARASGLEVRSSIPAGTRVDGSSDSTAQIVVAVLDNVRQHASSSPVDIRATRHRDTVALSIVDRGPGIDPGVREVMFERGVRGARSAGSGLGLYIARRLMKAQNGTIDVRSGPGSGAEFVLEFRRA
jgi:two-component system OmpR family sensor kinase